MKYVDEVIELSEAGMARTMAGGWDYVYSLSNDLTSASLATLAYATNEPVGYFMDRGIITPSNAAARSWLEMAAFDDVKRRNGRSYQELMSAIVDAPDEPVPRPALDVPQSVQTAAGARVDALFAGARRSRIAINLGSGGRWPKKMLDVDQVIRLVGLLRARIDGDVLLVGGAAEREKAALVAAAYSDDAHVQAALTDSSIAEFVAILMQVDALLCGDTLALHIATAVNLPTVAIFGPTSIAEIPEFDGLIVKTATRELDCLGCYGDCSKPKHCMSLLELDTLVGLIGRQLSRQARPLIAG